ncbi:MAG: hypothetical protein EOO28_25360 [Comamonadaceae bacterium]|nr:MAG: hypothetical protein EOO28_25360 [Comamonadaceae bacterium]
MNPDIHEETAAGTGLAQAAAGSAPAAGPSAADISAFDAAWDSAGGQMASMPADGLVASAGDSSKPSVLHELAAKQSQMLQQAYQALDENDLRRMSTIQVQNALSQKAIESNTAAASLNMGWNFLKTTRQSIETVMNSK